MKRNDILERCAVIFAFVFTLAVLLMAVWQSTQRGFVKTVPIIGTEYMYVGDDGQKLEGMHKIKNDYYYFSNVDGTMQVGFQKVKGKIYYFDKHGKRAKGIKRIGKQTYYFKDNGSMIQNEFISYYKNNRPHVSYFNKSGEMVVGRQHLDGRDYQFDDDGNLQIDIEKIKRDVSEIVKKYPGNIGVYFKDLRTDEAFTINDVSMYPCCMIKVPALVTIYSEIVQGNINYDDYAESIEKMITISDNTSYNQLMKTVGYTGGGVAGVHKVNELCRSLGLSRTQLHHGLIPGEGYFTDGGTNLTCPSDIGILLEHLYTQDILDERACDAMVDLLKRCEDNEEIKAGLPENVAYAHKTGCADSYYHDGGIVYLPGRDYILVIFSDGTSNYQSMMKDVSSYLYSYQDNLIK